MHILLQFKYLAYLFQCWDFIIIIIKSYHVIKLSPCLEKKMLQLQKRLSVQSNFFNSPLFFVMFHRVTT